jgi:hypothetical protein
MLGINLVQVQLALKANSSEDGRFIQFYNIITLRYMLSSLQVWRKGSILCLSKYLMSWPN